MPGKYLRREAEAEARYYLEHPPAQHYNYCLVIPAYRESARLADKLLRLAEANADLLIILVINQPDSDPGEAANHDLRQALASFTRVPTFTGANSSLLRLTSSSHMLLVERPLPLPKREGVGLARKLGCDIAASLYQCGCLQSRWLHNSDADASLAAGFFECAEQQAADTVAITHPFRHLARDGGTPDLAMQLYELRLHYYVLGLLSAGSPYAFHTLGSCLSIDVNAYQQVRGFPRRCAAEDFYLLNKVAKLGPVCTNSAAVITIEARQSDRVPFGTGPAVRKLATSDTPLDNTLFYNPNSFHALAAVLESASTLHDDDRPLTTLTAKLAQHGPAMEVLQQLGIAKCLQHCQRHSRNHTGFKRHFQQWFDGFRSLKFIHGLRQRGWEDLTLAQSYEHPARIWPETSSPDDLATMSNECRKTLWNLR